MTSLTIFIHVQKAHLHVYNIYACMDWEGLDQFFVLMLAHDEPAPRVKGHHTTDLPEYSQLPKV